MGLEPVPVVPEVGVLAAVPDPWGDCWQTRHHVLTRLARYFHVAWCNPHGADERAATASTAPPAGFAVHETPRWIPRVGRPAALARLLLRQRLRGARRALARRGCTETVLSLWRPHQAGILDVVPHRVSCYHIDDEYTLSEKQPIVDAEAALIRRVDQVFITSPALTDKKGHLNPNTRVLPNGVDYAAYTRDWPEPPDLAPIPRPRIGYVGVVKKQLDLTLVDQLARRHRSWSFVLVGPHRHLDAIGALIGGLAGLPNVYFLDEKPVRVLPGYTQHMDACMLCYKVDDYTEFIYPLKLHESLASGVPCVGAPIRTLKDFRAVVDLAGSVDEWSRVLTTVLDPSRQSLERRAARREVARRHDWNGLVHTMAVTIADRLGPGYRQRVEQARPVAPLPPPEPVARVDL